MDNKIYGKVLTTFNSSVQETVEMYVEARIKECHKELEQSKDFNRLLELQGAIAELKKLKNLRSAAYDVHEAERRKIKDG